MLAHPSPDSADVDRDAVVRFYGAIAGRDLDAVLSFFHDDITWSYSGPPAVLPFCGTRRGKAAVTLAYRQMFAFLGVVSFETLALVVEGDATAALIDFHGRAPDTGRIVTLRIAHFARWRAGRILTFRAMIDSLDAVEQVLGHELVPGDEPGDAAVAFVP